MAKSDIWMPIYIGDYLSDTMHLSTEQNGAYLLLLLYGWRNNGLIPSDDESLSQICRMPLESWKNNRAVISRFFQQGEYWTQKRQLEEIEKASNRRDAAKSNGIKGGRPKNNLQVSVGLTNGLAKPNPEESSLQLSSSLPLSLKSEYQEKEICRKSDLNKIFDSARKAYPGTKLGLDTEWKNFLKANKPEISDLLMLAIEKEKAYKEKCALLGSFVAPWKNFKTWVNQKCWEQEFSEIKTKPQQERVLPMALAGIRMPDENGDYND